VPCLVAKLTIVEAAHSLLTVDRRSDTLDIAAVKSECDIVPRGFIASTNPAGDSGERYGLARIGLELRHPQRRARVAGGGDAKLLKTLASEVERLPEPLLSGAAVGDQLPILAVQRGFETIGIASIIAVPEFHPNGIDRVGLA